MNSKGENFVRYDFWSYPQIFCHLGREVFWAESGKQDLLSGSLHTENIRTHVFFLCSECLQQPTHEVTEDDRAVEDRWLQSLGSNIELFFCYFGSCSMLTLGSVKMLLWLKASGFAWAKFTLLSQLWMASSCSADLSLPEEHLPPGTSSFSADKMWVSFRAWPQKQVTPKPFPHKAFIFINRAGGNNPMKYTVSGQ